MSSDDIQDSSYADSQEVQSSDLDTTTETHNDSEVFGGTLRDNLSHSSEETQKTNATDSFTQDQGVKDEQKFESSEIFGSELDQELHKEILEKLDIIKKEQVQDIQENLKQEKFKNTENSQSKNQIENDVKIGLSQDFAKIQKLVKTGLINSEQGQNLKKQVLKTAFDKLVQAEKIKRALSPASEASHQVNMPVEGQNKNEVFEEFSQKNPDFFTSNGRKEVLNYLKSGDALVGRDELSKISDIIRTVEKAAIDRYLQKVTHEKTLRSSNEVAKRRLTANAQKTGFSDKNLSRSFTRGQIGKMSSAEFAKYEPFIMDQLKKGLIK